MKENRDGRRGRTAFWGAGACLLFVAGVATATPASPTGADEGRPPRFQLEIYGGLGPAGLSDLNRLASYDDAVQEFFYDRLFEYQRQAGAILSWIKDLTGARGRIAVAFPFGARVRWRIAEPFSVSLGVRLTQGRRESSYSFVYTRNDPYGYEDKETVACAPYHLSAKFIAVQAGFHYARPLTRKLSAEAFLAAGPVFADCRYSSLWEYTWHKRGPDMNWDVTQMTGLLEEKGRGTGFAADLGARLEYPVGRRLAVFFEGAYSYQVVRTVKGRGREVRDDVETDWEGTWAFKTEHLQAPWGSLDVDTPTNYWPEGSASARSRRFRLDGSAFQARLGISVRL
jgi:hypothetical protein